MVTLWRVDYNFYQLNYEIKVFKLFFEILFMPALPTGFTSSKENYALVLRKPPKFHKGRKTRQERQYSAWYSHLADCYIHLLTDISWEWVTQSHYVRKKNIPCNHLGSFCFRFEVIVMIRKKYSTIKNVTVIKLH